MDVQLTFLTWLFMGKCILSDNQSSVQQTFGIGWELPILGKAALRSVAHCANLC